jgi:hypothetical protein
MNTVISDFNVVPETGSIGGKEIIFTMTLQGPVRAPMIIVNRGANQINYTFQEFNGVTWADISTVGTDLNGTLASGSSPVSVKVITVLSDYSQVRLIANSSGGSTLEFSALRFYNRAAGGAIPLLLIN